MIRPWQTVGEVVNPAHKVITFIFASKAAHWYMSDQFGGIEEPPDAYYFQNFDVTISKLKYPFSILIK